MAIRKKIILKQHFVILNTILYFVPNEHLAVPFVEFKWNDLKLYSHFRNVRFKLGFTPCKAEQPLQAMELQEKQAHKIKAYMKSL